GVVERDAQFAGVRLRAAGKVDRQDVQNETGAHGYASARVLRLAGFGRIRARREPLHDVLVVDDRLEDVVRERSLTRAFLAFPARTFAGDLATAHVPLYATQAGNARRLTP